MQENGKMAASLLPQESEGVPRFNITNANNMRTGSNKAHMVKRDPNAAPSTAPMRKEIHMPTNTVARHQ
jgi:hypothetical protein